MSKRSVAIQISGQEYRIRTDEEDDSTLERVAESVDRVMAQIRERTGTVDSLDVAILTCLHLARKLLTLGEQSALADDDAERLRGIIELAESAIESTGGDNETPLLTLPTGDEVEASQELLGTILEESGARPDGARG